MKNNLLLLIIPESHGSRTYYRRVLLNKEKKVLIDTYDEHLSFIGNFLQVIDEENDRTYYIDSRTESILDDVSLPQKDVDIPETFEVDGKVVKLMKQNVDKNSE